MFIDNARNILKSDFFGLSILFFLCISRAGLALKNHYSTDDPHFLEVLAPLWVWGLCWSILALMTLLAMKFRSLRPPVVGITASGMTIWSVSVLTVGTPAALMSATLYLCTALLLLWGSVRMPCDPEDSQKQIKEYVENLELDRR